MRSGAPNRKSTNPASALLPVASKIRRQAQLGDEPQASTSSGDGLTWRSTERTYLDDWSVLLTTAGCPRSPIHSMKMHSPGQSSAACTT